MPLFANNATSELFFQFDITGGAWVMMNGQEPLLNRGFLYGDGFFDTLAVFNGRILAYDLHIHKCEAAAKALELPLPDGWYKGVSDLITNESEAILRIYVYRYGSFGSSSDGAKPEIRAYLQRKSLIREKAVLKVDVGSDPIFSQSILHKHKTLNRLPYIIAERSIAGTSYDEVLLINENRQVASLTTSCLVYQQNRRIFTIPPEDGCMMSTAVTQFVSVVGRGKCKEKSLPIDEITSLDWLIGLNSLGPKVVNCVKENPLPLPPYEILVLLEHIYPFLNCHSATNTSNGIRLTEG